MLRKTISSFLQLTYYYIVQYPHPNDRKKSALSLSPDLKLIQISTFKSWDISVLFCCSERIIKQTKNKSKMDSNRKRSIHLNVSALMSATNTCCANHIAKQSLQSQPHTAHASHHSKSSVGNPPISWVPLSRVSTNCRQPIVFRFCYCGMSFRPLVVFELRWVIVCVMCMNGYLPLRALWCFSHTVFNEPNVKWWTKLVVPKDRERLWCWVKRSSCCIVWLKEKIWHLYGPPLQGQ